MVDLQYLLMSKTPYAFFTMIKHLLMHFSDLVTVMAPYCGKTMSEMIQEIKYENFY